MGRGRDTRRGILRALLGAGAVSVPGCSGPLRSDDDGSADPGGDGPTEVGGTVTTFDGTAVSGATVYALDGDVTDESLREGFEGYEDDEDRASVVLATTRTGNDGSFAVGAGGDRVLYTATWTDGESRRWFADLTPDPSTIVLANQLLFGPRSAVAERRDLLVDTSLDISAGTVTCWRRIEAGNPRRQTLGVSIVETVSGAVTTAELSDPDLKHEIEPWELSLDREPPNVAGADTDLKYHRPNVTDATVVAVAPTSIDGRTVEYPGPDADGEVSAEVLELTDDRTPPAGGQARELLTHWHPLRDPAVPGSAVSPRVDDQSDPVSVATVTDRFETREFRHDLADFLADKLTTPPGSPVSAWDVLTSIVDLADRRADVNLGSGFETNPPLQRSNYEPKGRAWLKPQQAGYETERERVVPSVQYRLPLVVPDVRTRIPVAIQAVWESDESFWKASTAPYLAQFSEVLSLRTVPAFGDDRGANGVAFESDFEDVPVGERPPSWTHVEGSAEFDRFEVEAGGAAGTDRALALRTHPFEQADQWGSRARTPIVDERASRVTWYWKKRNAYDPSNDGDLQERGPSFNLLNDREEPFVHLMLGTEEGYTTDDDYPRGLRVAQPDDPALFADLYEAGEFVEFALDLDFEAGQFDLAVGGERLGSFRFTNGAKTLHQAEFKVGGWGVSGDSAVDEFVIRVD